MIGRLQALVGVATIAAGASALQAAVLTDYRFTSYTPNPVVVGAASSPAEQTVIGATASGFTFTISNNEATVVGQTDTGFSTTSSNHAFVRSNATGGDQAAALVDDDAFTFTVTANAGKRLNLTSLAFDQGASNGLTGASDQLTNVLYAIVDGNVIGSSSASFNQNTGTAFKATRTFDLSGAAYQGLSTITIRLAFSDNLNASTVVNRLDNVVLNGDVVAVPEPAGLGLAAVGVAALAGRRRRRV